MSSLSTDPKKLEERECGLPASRVTGMCAVRARLLEGSKPPGIIGRVDLGPSDLNRPARVPYRRRQLRALGDESEGTPGLRSTQGPLASTFGGPTLVCSRNQDTVPKAPRGLDTLRRSGHSARRQSIAIGGDDRELARRSVRGVDAKFVT